MGKKKGKKEKKVSGAEKTALKTEKKADKKAKKELKRKGEEDIEHLIAEFQEQDRKRIQIVEKKCDPPSPRCNMTLTVHPDKDELIMFGGEYFDGKKTFMYNDLFFYNVSTHQWSTTKAPNAPPPRCAHQAVALRQGGGQLWIFGGEFASPTQSQFYHYKDLWVFHFKEKLWEKVRAPGGPTARSGHRMAVCKKRIIVFGGFHDNIRDYKYFNDVFSFDLENLTWCKLDLSGVPPSPRSGCQIAATQDQTKLVVYGGYSKERVKKDIDKGKVHTDMYILQPDDKSKKIKDSDVTEEKWKWVAVKQSGSRPSPRCGFSLVATPGNRAVLFGGVFDEEEDDEDIEGVFFNEMYNLELDSGKWHEVFLRGKKSDREKKRRRKKKEDGEDADGSEEECEMEDDLENLNVNESQAKDRSEGAECAAAASHESDIFTVKIGPQITTSMSEAQKSNSSDDPVLFVPHPRMNTLLAVKHGVLYMYGGIYEAGDKQITLSDMYSLDLHRLDEWNVIIESDLNEKLKLYKESDSSSSESEDEDMDTEDAETKEDDSDMEEETPEVEDEEEFTDYFCRTKEFWLDEAETVAEKEGLEVTGRRIKKAATRMAEEYFSNSKKS